MNQPLWISTGNAGKLKELAALAKTQLPGVGEVYAKEAKDVVESAATFAGNARIKAEALAAQLIAEGERDFFVLADDSGLCVDLLGGAPGVYSARYGGEGADAEKNLQKLLSELAALSIKLEERSAQYCCALCLIQVKNGNICEDFEALGILPGIIGDRKKGSQGFGYDPIFWQPATLLSYAEISFEEKNKDSHRSRAFENLRAAVLNKNPKT